MSLDYHSETLRLEELNQKEAQNEKLLFSLQKEEISNDEKGEILKISFEQLSILKEKNDLYSLIINKLEALVQIYIKPMNTPRTKYVNVEGLEDIQESPSVYKVKKNSTDNELNNEDNLEEYIDKLNNNIELLKKAFSENVAEIEKTAANTQLEESTLTINPESVFHQTDITRKKEKSLFYMPAEIEDIESEAQRKFKSFNFMSKNNVEHALENSSFSISLLNKKIKAYPEKIRSLEQEIIFLNEHLFKAQQENSNLDKKIAEVIAEQKQKDEEIYLLNQANTLKENEIQLKNELIKEMKKTLEVKEQALLKNENIHYKLSNSLNDIESCKKPSDIILSENKKGCCTVF